MWPYSTKSLAKKSNLVYSSTQIAGTFTYKSGILHFVLSTCFMILRIPFRAKLSYRLFWDKVIGKIFNRRHSGIDQAVALLSNHIKTAKDTRNKNEDNFIDIPFYSFNGLQNMARLARLNWSRNEEHIIESGYSKTLFMRMQSMEGLFQCLYPVRILYKREFRKIDKYGNGLYDYYWKDLLIPSIAKEEDDNTPSIDFFIADPESPPFNDIPSYKRPKYDFEYSPYIENIPNEVISYIETWRGSIYRSFMGVYEVLEDSSRISETNSLLEICLTKIFKYMGPSTIELCLAVDEFMDSSSLAEIDKWTLRRSYGGLKRLFRLIGHFEKEIQIGTVKHTHKMLGGFIARDKQDILILAFDSYFEHSENLEQKNKIDTAIQTFLKSDAEETGFWEDYYGRVNKHLKNRGVKAKLENDFKPYLTRVRDSIKARYQCEDLFPIKDKPVEIPSQDIENIELPEEVLSDKNKTEEKEPLLPKVEALVEMLYKEREEKKNFEEIKKQEINDQLSQNEKENTTEKVPSDQEVADREEVEEASEEQEINWEEYALIVFDFELLVKKKGKWKKERYNLEKAGLGNMTIKGCTPNRLWPLMQYFGEKGGRTEREDKGDSCYGMKILKWGKKRAGEIRSDDPNIDKIICFDKGKNRDRKLTKYVSDLRDTLKSLFEIETDPIASNSKTKHIDHSNYFLEFNVLRAHWSDISISLEKNNKGISYDIGGLYQGQASFQKLGLAKKGGVPNRFGDELIKILKRGGKLKFGFLKEDEIESDFEEGIISDDTQEKPKVLNPDTYGYSQKEGSPSVESDSEDDVIDEDDEMQGSKNEDEVFDKWPNEEEDYNSEKEHTEYLTTDKSKDIWKKKALVKLATKLKNYFGIQKYPFEEDEEDKEPDSCKTLFKVSRKSLQL